MVQNTLVQPLKISSAISLAFPQESFVLTLSWARLLLSTTSNNTSLMSTYYYPFQNKRQYNVEQSTAYN